MKTTQKVDLVAITWVVVVCAAVFAAFVVAAHAQTVQLDPGMSGPDVSALQTFLATDSSVYPEGLVTGYYGDLTTAAVQRYQCKNGIVCSGDPTSTGYGRVGPATLAKIEMQEGAAPGDGITLPPTGSPAIGSDVNAPIINAPLVATTSSSASITWTTNELANSRVMYAPSWPFLYATAASAPSTNGFSQGASATITGLMPNTLYYYVLESVDASGNLQWSIDHSFRTNP